MINKDIRYPEDFPVCKCLNAGFVALVDTFGGDQAIVQAARVSYGEGTHGIRSDKALINYLLRHRHTSPFEMVEMKFLCRMPIFVARQWIRHRTANVNEYSGRYSEMKPYFFEPHLGSIAVQSENNKQGRDENFNRLLETTIKAINDQNIANNPALQNLLNSLAIIDEEIHLPTYKIWQKRLCCLAHLPQELLKASKVIEAISNTNYRAWDTYQRLLNQGVSREIARVVLPLTTYTEWYWKMDLHNLLHFLRLRLDPHAQPEIRVYAEAIAHFVKQQFPLTYEVFKDIQDGCMLTGQERKALNEIIDHQMDPHKFLNAIADKFDKLDLSQRYIEEFYDKMKFNGL